MHSSEHRTIRLLAIAGLAAGAYACSQSTPTAPVPDGTLGHAVSSEGGGNALVNVCHVLGNGSFSLISVSASAQPAHLRHGDGVPGGAVPGGGGAVFNGGCNVVAAGPATISFDGITSDGTPFASLTEDGFTISAVSGPWEERASFGNPRPFIQIFRQASDPSISGSVEITDGGSLFRFMSIDLYSSITPIPYELVGMVAGAPAFTIAATNPGTLGQFVTIANPNSATPIDTLVITMTNPVSCCQNPMGFDNVELIR